jgi:hypothetical protein
MSIFHVEGNDVGWCQKKNLATPSAGLHSITFTYGTTVKHFLDPVKSEIDDTGHLKLRIREAVKIPNVLSWGCSDSRKQVFCWTKR